MATEDNILQMIKIAFHMGGSPLVSTDAETAYKAYLDDKDLKTFKDSLETFRDSLVEDNEMHLSTIVNDLYQIINVIFIEKQTGDSSLTSLTLVGSTADASSNLSDQSIALNRLLQAKIGTDALDKTGFLGATEATPTSLVAYANLVTGALGNGKLLENDAEKSSLSEAIGTIETGLIGVAGTSVAKAIGNKALVDFSLAGTTTSASTDLSNHLVTFIAAAETAVGTAALSKTGFLGATEATPASIVAHANLVTSALGNGKLLENDAEKSSLSEAIGTIETGLLGTSGTSVAKAIGNKELASFSLLGKKTDASSSLSDQLGGFISAAQTAIGDNAIAPSTERSVNSCSYSLKKGGTYTLGDEIYTTSNDVSQYLNNLASCGKWVDDARESGNNLYFSHTGSVDDCSGRLDAGEALAICHKYLHPDV